MITKQKNRKNIFIVAAFFLSSFVFGQSGWFGESEDNAQQEQPQQQNEQYQTDTDPGGMGGPVPIDGFLPLLLVTATGLLVYATCKKPQLK